MMNSHQKNLSQSHPDRRNKSEISSLKKGDGYLFLAKKESAHFCGNLGKKNKILRQKVEFYEAFFPPANF